jgi:hypothetical protein
VITARLLSAWDGVVGSTALLAIIILALCVMVGVGKAGDVPWHLGVIMCIVILLIMLPAIIAGLWSAMSSGQHLEIVAIGLMMAVLLGALRRGKRQRSRRTHRGD